MALKTSDLTASEKLIIERRRNSKETQAKAAKRHGVTVNEYRAWERDGDDAPRVKLGKLAEHEACYILRRRGGWTIEEVANDMGICRWWLCQMEHGEAPVARLTEYWSTQKVS